MLSPEIHALIIEDTFIAILKVPKHDLKVVSNRRRHLCKVADVFGPEACTGPLKNAIQAFEEAFEEARPEYEKTFAKTPIERCQETKWQNELMQLGLIPSFQSLWGAKAEEARKRYMRRGERLQDLYKVMEHCKARVS